MFLAFRQLALVFVPSVPGRVLDILVEEKVSGFK